MDKRNMSPLEWETNYYNFFSFYLQFIKVAPHSCDVIKVFFQKRKFFNLDEACIFYII